MNNRIHFTPIFCLILVLSFFGSVFGNNKATHTYSQVEFDLDIVSLEHIGNLGIPVDHYDASTGRFIELTISHYGVEQLNKHGIPHKILHKDYSAYIEQRNIRYKEDVAAGRVKLKRSKNAPENWKHGSMGGMFHLEEALDEIDLMREKFPHLISERFQIGESIEGRPIWAIRLSNSPDSMDTSRINVVYNTLTHPREPMALMSMMWFFWDVLEKYGEDEDITKMLDYMELYYIPIVNPDGFEHNYNTNPNGGGLWRKNRRDHGGGTFGTDINRNYSVSWGNNVGSSGNKGADTYRGSEPFSEPETQAVEAFYKEINPSIASTFHCYANVLLTPYGVSGVPDNNDVYTALSEDMSADNGWEFGRVPPTIGYQAAGIEIDWVHDVIGALGINPEMGSSQDGGFWPPEGNIDRLAESGYVMNLAMAKFMFSEIVSTKPEEVSPYSNKITDNFALDINKVGDQLNINYQMLDNKNSWQVSLVDLNGKIFYNNTLSQDQNSLNIPMNELSQSVYILNINSCNNARCQTVSSQKIVR